jgi:ATP-dependent helicase/nuclease subunit B
MAVPFATDILAAAAQQIIAQAATLPDLTHVTVLLPDLQFGPRLRRHLLHAARDRGHAALLGPDIHTLEHWLSSQVHFEQDIPGRARRELLLVEVLKEHPSVFGNTDPWKISASLVALFDELTLNRVSIPDDLQAFTDQLQAAYRIADRLPEPLGMEAGVVHRLWQAWHEQLAADRLLDPGMAALQRLAACRAVAADSQLLLVGFDSFSAAELEWLDALLDAGHTHCLLYRQAVPPAGASPAPLQVLLEQASAHDPADGTDPVARCLDAVFETGRMAPRERALQFRSTHPDSPLGGQLAVFAANAPEQEARAIDLQIRQWLLEGRQPLGIVTGDRRLARRVRALLERAGIHLQDSGGWALSTTSTAAALERWLETVEEDFAHQPLLDVLKSPFIFPEDDREQLSGTVFRLEQDIIRHENIARGLARYRRHIDLRLQRLSTRWTGESAAALHILLNRLDQAAEPLRACLDDTHATPAHLLEQLRDSLQQLGMWQAFQADLAGQRILQEWQLLFDAAQHSPVAMSWIEFRAWFGSALERHDFRPATADSPVMLLTLQQAQLGQFAGLVIGACDREYLPASPAGSPFFNDPVRHDLGLPVWPEHYMRQLNQFRRLLESAPSVLLTWHSEVNGETRMPSPWLEAIQTFHRLAWDDDLQHPTLAALLDDPATRVRGSNPLPAPQPAAHPAAILPADQLPASLSVSAHRCLIDCPYRFFAAYGLELKPKEAVSEAFEKAEYGSLVHRALEAFHTDSPGLPPAFGQPVTGQNRSAAIASLEHISRQVFSRELEDNFEHRAWLRRWLVLIPEYIGWQIRHQAEWAFSQAELPLETPLLPGRVLKGRLDRIDSGAGGSAILDYKTGGIPRQADVDSGEEVQLPSYALLLDTLPARVEYLKVDQKVTGGPALEGAALEQLARDTRQRLVTVLADIEQGAPLPAWGDAGTCRYCEMDGLCRQQAWLEADADTAQGDPP